ncbi:hypothetical protein FOZ63_002693, partial [Perkinsus olseni]
NTPVKPRLAHGLTVVAAVEREAPTLSRNLSPYDITEALSALVGAFTPEAPATARATWWTPRVGKLKAKFQRAQWRYHRHKREHAPLRFITVRIVADLKHRKAFNRLMKAIMEHLDVTAAAQQDSVIKKMPLFSDGGNREEGRQQLRKPAAAGDGRVLKTTIVTMNLRGMSLQLEMDVRPVVIVGDATLVEVPCFDGEVVDV